MKKNKAETKETILKLIGIARHYFTDHGFANTSLEAIVKDANMTRGALYHHFPNKKELFRIVFESVHEQVGKRVEQEAEKGEDGWEQLQLGCRAFLAAAIEEDHKRIMLIDGPAVLGWEAWRTFDQKNAMRLLHEQLTGMQAQGLIKEMSVEALTHLLSGALNEASLWCAQHQNQQQAVEETMAVVELFLQGLKR
ncbi:TetR/AcrR family transcriptional regulator [Aureibacillus halotolerans]|uniref:TetR family transcriptional regulator n=1 Tax=Aureibacillus halotolerans TaxID=1508390 RepID=A0A4R6U669_9BACI|nr:TetR/AcrR family transcriptional regulator [Aureibacillus halotolerans]TDQ40353.1 TetR family transcriptional regulator [Aureibacillus halotolerans]